MRHTASSLESFLAFLAVHFPSMTAKHLGYTDDPNRTWSWSEMALNLLCKQRGCWQRHRPWTASVCSERLSCFSIFLGVIFLKDLLVIVYADTHPRRWKPGEQDPSAMEFPACVSRLGGSQSTNKLFRLSFLALLIGPRVSDAQLVLTAWSH